LQITKYLKNFLMKLKFLHISEDLPPKCAADRSATIHGG